MNVRQILYPTDFSSTAKQALTQALFLAEQFEAELHMLHAVVLHDYDPSDPDHKFPEPADIFSRLFEIADSEMAELVKDREAKTFSVREAKVRGFSPAQVILDYAAEHDVDLIVMGTHGRRGAARLLMGSVAEEVVRLAGCPVLTLRGREEPREIEAIERIVVPLDFSKHSQQALAHAKGLAARYQAGLELLHVIEEPSYPYFYAPIGGLGVGKHLEELQEKATAELERLAAETPGPEVPTDFHVASGRPSSEVVQFAEERGADMIVIATHGLTGVERMLVGSTAEHVVRHATCPVFTVKSFGKSLI